MKKSVLFTAQIFLAIPESSSDVDYNTALAKGVEKHLISFLEKLEKKYVDAEILVSMQYL